jgi:hypothetical protein
MVLSFCTHSMFLVSYSYLNCRNTLNCSGEIFQDQLRPISHPLNKCTVKCRPPVCHSLMYCLLVSTEEYNPTWRVRSPFFWGIMPSHSIILQTFRRNIIFFILKVLDTRILDPKREDTRGHACRSLKIKAKLSFETSLTVYPVAPRH